MDLGTLVRQKKEELNVNLDYDLQGARTLRGDLGVNIRQKTSVTNTWPVITFDNYSQVNVQVPHLFSSSFFSPKINVLLSVCCDVFICR